MPRSKAKTTENIEVTELLHQDHLKVRDLFFQFSKSDDASEKESLCNEILTELFVHATIEEEIVYPAVESEAEEGEDLVQEAETEHHVVKFLMAELSEMKGSDDKFDAKVTVLCELVNHHIGEEEKEMFKQLRESGADLEELAQQVIARKEELMGQPLPSMEATLQVGDADLSEGKAAKKTPTSIAKSKNNVSKKRKSA